MVFKKKYKPEKQDNKGPFKKKKIASFYTLGHMRAVHRYARGQKFAQPSAKRLFPHSFGFEDVTVVTSEDALADETDMHANQLW